MKYANQWRLENAHAMARAFAAGVEVEAVVLTGAVADEIADDYSETHVHVFWTELPSAEQQQRVLDRAGGVSFYGVGEFEKGVPAEGYAPFVLPAIISQTQGTTGWWLDDKGKEMNSAYLIELENDSLETVERSMRQALVEHRIERTTLDMLGTIQQGRPLYGEALIEQWRQRLNAYPDELKRAMIEYSTAEMWQQIRYAKVLAVREDVVAYFCSATVIVHNVLKVLFAVNGLFGWQETPKRYAHRLERFASKPDACYRRISRIFSPPLEQSFEDLLGLARETIDLAVAGVPGIEEVLDKYMLDEPRRWLGPSKTLGPSTSSL
jgi:hypothetical protein